MWKRWHDFIGVERDALSVFTDPVTNGCDSVFLSEIISKANAICSFL